MRSSPWRQRWRGVGPDQTVTPPDTPTRWGHPRPSWRGQLRLSEPYVACTGQAADIDFAKEGNCFTRIDQPQRLAQVADTLSQPGTVGRLRQVIDSWIYTACLCFGLDLADQERSGFGYAYSIYQVEYSRNLIFASGRVMEKAFDTIVDRTRVRMDVPRLRTLFGVGQRPRNRGGDLSPRQAVVIERPRWNLTLFKVNFGLLTLKGYTKGEHVLRFEAIVHNTKRLHTGRVLEKFPDIVARLTGMVDRFTAMLDCVDVGFLPDGVLDDLPTGSQLGATRVSGVDINKPRIRAVLAAVLALAVSPEGFTVADLAAKVQSLTGRSQEGYTVRQATYDLRKLRGKQLVVKPVHRRRYHVPDQAARTITALLAVREEVIAPILAAVRVPRQDRPPRHLTVIDRDYKSPRAGMCTLFQHLAIGTEQIAA